MSAIEDIVAQARTLVKGIDWDKLDSESRGVSLDPDIAPHLGYWVDYLGPAFNRAADVMNTLYYDPIIVNTAQTTNALDAVWRVIRDTAPEVQAYMRLKNPWLLFSPVALPAEDYRLVLSYMWGVIMYGTRLHTSFAIVAMGRQAWREHANYLVMMCEAISLMDQAGMLSRLKWDAKEMVELRAQQGVSNLKPFTEYVTTVEPKKPTAGLGLAPALAVAIITGAVIGIVMIFALYEWAKTTTEINRQTLLATGEICSNPTYANDPATKQQCVAVLGTALANSTKPKLPGLDTAVKYLMIAGGVVAFVAFAPQIFALARAMRPKPAAA